MLKTKAHFYITLLFIACPICAQDLRIGLADLSSTADLQSESQSVSQSEPDSESAPQSDSQAPPNGESEPQSVSQDQPQAPPNGESEPQSDSQDLPDGEAAPQSDSQAPPNGESEPAIEGDWLEDFNTRLRTSLADRYSVQTIGNIGSINDLPESEISNYDIIIIPTVEEFEEIDERTIRIQGTYRIQTLRNGSTDYGFNVIGYSEDRVSSIDRAINEALRQLNIHVLDFQTFIIVDRFERRVFFRFDSGLGGNILPGDEFEVVQDSDDIAATILRVRDVQGELIIADVILEESPLSIGNEIRRLERIGIGILPYISTSFDISNANFGQLGIGSKFIWEYGLYALRPILALEFLFPRRLFETGTGFSILSKIGLEYRINFGRFSIIPQVFWGIAFGELDDRSIGLEFTEANVSLGFAYLFPSQNENIEFYGALGYKSQSRERPQLNALYSLDLIHIELGVRIR